MASSRTNAEAAEGKASMVLYCLLVKKDPEGASPRLALLEKNGSPTFPPTKFRPGEDLYSGLVRPMETDLELPAGTYFPETELPMIPNAGQSPRYPGLAKKWHLYPVFVSLTDEGWRRMERKGKKVIWWELEEVLFHAQEPNVRAIANFLREHHPQALVEAPQRPTMDALASAWAARNGGGLRVLEAGELQTILGAGQRAFNLRVADPYLPYQKQGLGFTWSFFTAKDPQDVHVHGLPAVEIYGVMKGKLQVWSKPMNQRGVRTWRCTLAPGDWAEVEPILCHFACWVTPEGLGTVVKAAATGELAGVGKLGVSGKTTCSFCNAQRQCVLAPELEQLAKEYAKPFENRDYGLIERLAAEGQLACGGG